LATERDEAVILFIRGEGEAPVSENEEYAQVYLEARGPERWFTGGPSTQLENIKRGLYPFYVVPVPKLSGYWILDATKPVAISTFDDFNPSLLVAQLNYLVSPSRTALDFTSETGQAIFDHISGALLDYARLQDDYDQDLSAVVRREFLNREYLSLVEAAKPIVKGGSSRTSPYTVDVSEKINSLFSWDEALRLTESIEGRVNFMIDYLHRCNDSIAQIETRAMEFEKHARYSKDELAKEFEDYKSLKGREEVDVTEKCETDRQDIEKTYKPMLSKAEKQLKAAKESNEAALLELMPVQSVYDDMHIEASKLQDSISQTTAAREEASQKAIEFRTKYTKLQEDQSNIQARSTKEAGSKSVPEDTPLDAEMAYLERQALTYESKRQQLDEELTRLSDAQTKGNAELQKFDKTYRPIKERTDEAKTSYEGRAGELEKLKQQKVAEMDAVEKRCQGEKERIKSEIAEAEAVLGRRVSSIDTSLEGLRSSMSSLKATLVSAAKYADETIQTGLAAITISGRNPSRVLYNPFYLGIGYNTPSPMPVMGRDKQVQVGAPLEGQGSKSPYAKEAIDSYVQGMLPSLQLSGAAGDFNLFSQIEFKGRLILGFKELAKKGLISESRMLKLAREVAIVGLKPSQVHTGFIPSRDLG